jgi:hypothetical protein
MRRALTACAVLTLIVAAVALHGCDRQTTGGGERSLGVGERPYAVRGIYGQGHAAHWIDGPVRIGFNLIDTGPYPDELGRLATRGVKGFVWLGGYSNTSCAFNRSDAWVRSHVAAIADSRAVGAYFIDDEPDAARCPNAPREIRARSRMVKSIDPGPPTFIVTYKIAQLQRLAGTVDVIGLDHYPCTIEHGCDYAKIGKQAAAADRLGIRYWGVIQAHGDDWYKLPTRDELHFQFVHWRATKMEGYLVFAWNWPREHRALWLANDPELKRQLLIENGA